MWRRRVDPLPEAISLSIDGAEHTIRLVRNAKARRYILRLPATGGDPVLTVPQRGTLETARDFAHRQRDWLARQLAGRPDPVPFADGGRVPLRGTPHAIVAGGGLRGLVQVRDGTPYPALVVPGDAAHLGRKLTDWLRREARRDLEAAVSGHAERLGARVSGLTLRDTRSRWGSCSSTGRLSFSWRLVLAPPAILDYVAAHEVAHLREMNHGPRFWALCRELAPQTDTARDWLRREGARLHLYG